jgi:hypothetical protein
MPYHKSLLEPFILFLATKMISLQPRAFHSCHVYTAISFSCIVGSLGNLQQAVWVGLHVSNRPRGFSIWLEA